MLGQSTPTINWKLAGGWATVIALGAGVWWASTIKDPPTARKSVVGNARRSRRSRMRP